MGSTLAEKFERLQKSGWRVVLLEKDPTTTQCHLLTRNMCIAEPHNYAQGMAHKMSGMEGGENWSKLCSLGGQVSTLALILEGET